MWIDSHCHLETYEDLPQVLANAQARQIDALLAIGIGEGPDEMHQALDLARAHPQIFATAGIHPQEARRVTPQALEKLIRLASDPRCLAIGEIGLDYYHVENPEIAAQKSAFIAQMTIAATVRKPIVIHCRTSELATPAAKQRFGLADAWDDLLALIAEHWTPTGLPGIMHCFSGNRQQAERSLAAGFYISFAGNVTYPRSTLIQEVARNVPADRILVETDAPFLAPGALRGKRNEPANVATTGEFVAKLRGTSPTELAAQTSANFYTLFPAARAAQ